MTESETTIPWADWAIESLERPFSSRPETITAFLVNALYLVGRHRILDWQVGGGAMPGAGTVAQELQRLGHDVTAVRDLRAARGRRFDRAMSLRRSFGYGTDQDNLGWLLGMRARLEPGGLLCFHVFDRDRAWQLAESETLDGRGLRIRREAEFDPASGRFAVGLREAGRRRGAAAPLFGPRVSVRAYNLTELRALLSSAGLALERAYGDWEAGNVADAGKRTGGIIAVAAKPRRDRATRKGGPVLAR